MCEWRTPNQYYIDTLKQFVQWDPAGCMVVSAENLAANELTSVKSPQRNYGADVSSVSPL